MIKTIKLREGCEITLANDSLWMEHYRDQFGHDVLSELMPLLLGVSKMMGLMAQEVGDLGSIGLEDVIRFLASDDIYDAGIGFASFESTEIMHIMWAMAKAYDENIEDPKAWQRKLAGENHESMPIADVIIPAVGELAFRGVMSSKNWERLTKNLQNLRDSMQPKKTTKSK